MLGGKRVSVSAGARVRITSPGPVPVWSVWDPCQRTSTTVKRRLQELFFKGDKRVQAQVTYIASEALRDRMRKLNRAKIEVRDAAGATVVLLADTGNLQAA